MEKKTNNLEDLLVYRDQYTKKLEAKIAKMEIQLAFINRKKL